MKKFLVFSATIFISSLTAGLYGAAHDQITYTISPEYYTKFKFIQFDVAPQNFGGYRPAVAIIGFLATWWTGVIIGLGLALSALIFSNHHLMCKAITRAILLVFCIAVAAAICGFFYGKYVLAEKGVNWWLPNDLTDQNTFITVGTIHNFSYLGGLIGLIAGIVYLATRNKRQVQSTQLNQLS